MGRERLSISDVARATELNRSTVAAMYHETVQRIDIEAVDRICTLFRCSVGDLLEHTVSIAKPIRKSEQSMPLKAGAK